MKKRLTLEANVRDRPGRPFVVRARELKPRPGFDFDKVNELIELIELIEQAEGP